MIVFLRGRGPGDLQAHLTRQVECGPPRPDKPTAGFRKPERPIHHTGRPTPVRCPSETSPKFRLSLVSGERFFRSRTGRMARLGAADRQVCRFRHMPANRPRFEFGAHSAPARGRMRVRMTRGPKARRGAVVTTHVSERNAARRRPLGGRRTRPSPVAMRPRHGPPRTGGPDQCVKVVKESHERRVPVSRLLVRSNRRSRKTPQYRPLRTGTAGVPKICGPAGSTLRLCQRECVKFGAGRLTAADRIPVGASRERGVSGPVLRVRAPSGKTRAKASDPRVTGATLPHALVRTMTGVSPS